MSGQGLKEFQEIIGYTFRNVQLLKNALTHSSYANERHWDKTKCKALAVCG
jgi:ribonuclease-3